jgi:hypothetical protein
MGGLSTFIPLAAPNLYEIQVFVDKKDEKLFKKSIKNYDVLHKCKNIWATQCSWVEMFKSDFG